MIVTTVVLTNAAQAKCFHSQCRSRMYAVTHQILNLNCILSLEPNGDQWNFGKQHQQGPQNSYPISARSLEGFNITADRAHELTALNGCVGKRRYRVPRHMVHELCSP